MKAIPRATRKQIREAVKILRQIPVCRITRDSYACAGCDGENQDDCEVGCWAHTVEECDERLSALIGERWS